jgi:hypothetical protein
MERNKINIKKTLSKHGEFKAAGLNKLSPNELANLNTALFAHRNIGKGIKGPPPGKGPQRLHMKKILTPAEFKAAGLRSLSGAELQALDNSLNTHHLDLGQGPISH